MLREPDTVVGRPTLGLCWVTLGLCWVGLGQQLGVAPRWACASTRPGPFLTADGVRLGQRRFALELK